MSVEHWLEETACCVVVGIGAELVVVLVDEVELVEVDEASIDVEEEGEAAVSAVDPVELRANEIPPPTRTTASAMSPRSSSGLRPEGEPSAPRELVLGTSPAMSRLVTSVPQLVQNFEVTLAPHDRQTLGSVGVMSLLGSRVDQERSSSRTYAVAAALTTVIPVMAVARPATANAPTSNSTFGALDQSSTLAKLSQA